ncbi:DUF5672 family protein [Butyrivibrio sp. MC2013]|uniref:DUF5672 family protein n=1 Tax=Butyrivibrio sp. MC2013 TaxID=1280686 RepID=UPI00042A5AB8|nr:DUF5672 family protein [Butyrivibrio sp. MC2013]
MHKCCVIIPIYKEKLNLFEKISLEQVHRVLCSYHIFYVAPLTLHISEEEYKEKAIVERFDNHYFNSTASYSELLLSEDFYIRFEKYHYTLIYQLDAFVFSNRLMEFVDMGYDYIGAPIAKGRWKEYHVGNGGFSLRKVNTTLELVRNKEYVPEWEIRKEIFLQHEDDFFAYCGHLHYLGYRVPDPMIASTFSAQDDCFHGLRDIAKRGLPFGTHHFPDWNYSFWKPVIESLGYKLPDVSDVISRDILKEEQLDRYESYFIHYLYNVNDEYKENIRCDLHLDRSISYVIWGYGNYGKKLLRLFINLGISVIGIIDREQRRCDYNIDFFNNLKEYLETNHYSMQKIVIATSSFEKEIVDLLLEANLEEGKDFIRYSSFVELLRITLCNQIPLFPEITGITSPITAGVHYR